MGQVESLLESMQIVHVDGVMLDRIRCHTTKLWMYEVIGGVQPQRLMEYVYLAQTLRKTTKNYKMIRWEPGQSTKNIITN